MQPEYRMWHNYELTDGVEIWELTAKDIAVLEAAEWLVDNNKSLSETAKNFCISKSCLYHNLMSRLPSISYELYKVVRKALKRHRQGR